MSSSLPRRRLFLLAAGLVAMLAGTSIQPGRYGARGQTQAGTDSAPAPPELVVPFFRKYCMDCHAGDEPMAGLSLDRLADDLEHWSGKPAEEVAQALAERREHWQKILHNLRKHVMPPQEANQPAQEEIDVVTGWIAARLTDYDCSGPADPGRVTIRRLNRTEYNNTVRDLLGLDFKPADDFPVDDVGYGFDHIGDVLALPPLLLEKYLDAAEQIVERAIVAPEEAPRQRFEAAQAEQTAGGGRYGAQGRVLASSGEVFIGEAPIETGGQYIFRVRAFARQAGDEPARMSLRVDDQEAALVDVTAVENEPAVYEARLPLEPGKHRLAAAFVNDYYRPDHPDPVQRDRNLYVEYLEIQGPSNPPAEKLPESHRRVVFCHPSQGADAAACARQIIDRFASRAYRRPAQPEEVERLAGLVELAMTDGESFERGIQLAMQAVLVSPHFLFRVEVDPPGAQPGAAHPIGEYELATRLSYFLWSSMPDDELFARAAAGTLRADLDSQVRRMLADPKAHALVENFVGQWLQTRRLETMTPDVVRFPTFDDELRQAMERETELFFAAIKEDDRSVLELLDADFTFLNERLARHYGIEGVEGDEFRRVALGDGPRGGVLTQASVLTATSNPTRTSPVKRGKWILEQFLGTPPPPPPPGVDELSEEDGAALTGTLRQRMEQHRADPGCASCHRSMDPLGFGLENFDAIGAWRDREGQFAIDASGELPDGSRFNGPAELKRILLGKRDQFVRCLAEKMLTYALGRGLEYYDQCAIDEITARMADNDYKFSTLIHAVVASSPFQLRRASPDAEQVGN